MAISNQVLVWGATPTDTGPLFTALLGSGPKAGEFRVAVREALTQRLVVEGVGVCFSEDGETYQHHRDNPGLYEPLQLKDAKTVLLLLPSHRAMAVNTWELALACESSPDGESLHMTKLAFVLPKTLYHYLSAAMKEGVEDPAFFVWKDPASEPVLGAQNSFAVRWIYRIVPEKFAAAKDSGNPDDVLPITWYDDSEPWELSAAKGKELIGKIANFAVAHLPT